MDPKSALGGPKPISRTGGYLLKKLKLHIKSMYLFQYVAVLETTCGKNTVYPS